MLEVIVSLVLHCVISFVLTYCYDKELIWHNNEKLNLHIPELYDLNENCSIYVQQKYVENVIIPARCYFSRVADIEYWQNENDSNGILIKLIAYTLNIMLAANSFRKADFFPFLWLNLVVAFAICIAISYIISFIYKRTKFKLDEFQLSVSDIKKEFYDIRQRCDEKFDISEENALNNFIIRKHYSYINSVYHTIQKRYYVKDIVDKIAAIIYFLFYMNTEI